jgi:hypothetical protein
MARPYSAFFIANIYRRVSDFREGSGALAGVDGLGFFIVYERMVTGKIKIKKSARC